ncbi:MAG TPA: NAD(P)-dependent oxidoreductase [Caulobacteraceae bacterium]|jgi:3-hydroxyisobutyrate dehydrogenase|nr:NAD(P)-dependent oxidoreductase [Caulobacteraceae bacterium]
MRIAFVGLGVMGYPMAGHLAAAGHEMRVFNRTPDKAGRWVAQHGGVAAGSLAELVRDREAVGLCVGNDGDVRQCLAEILPNMPKGGVIVDHTTTSAKLAREAAGRAREHGLWFVDAPVSGGQAGAQAGALSIMAGGDEEAFALAEPVMAAYAKAIRHIGGPGDGQLCKMVNQIAIAGVVQGLAEAVHFATRSGLDTGAVYEAISKGAAQSWQMDNRFKTMVDGRFDFGFAVDWMRKDLGLVLDEARANGARLEVTALVDQFYAELQAMGGRRWDTSSLAARLERPE